MIKNKDTRDFLKALNSQMRSDDVIISGLDSIEHQETYEEYQARSAANAEAKEKELADIKSGTKGIEFSDSVIESLRASILEPLKKEVENEAGYQSKLMPRDNIPGVDEIENLLDLEHEKLSDAETRIHLATITDNSEALSKAVQDRDNSVERICDYENRIDELKAADN